jgi:pyruvate formate lyase activating enzyme
MVQLFSAWNEVRGFEPVSLCDWPGRVTSVLFLGGCNLRCPTCHNAGLAWRPERFPAIPRQSIMDYLAARRRWLDGVVVTGGEPSLALDLAVLLADLKRQGLPVKMDTNGMRPDVVADLLDASLVDVFAVDVKGPFAKYPELTGQAVSADQARDNLSRIFSLAENRPGNFYFRTTLVPALTDEDVASLPAALPQGFSLTFQQYVPPGRTRYAQADPQTRRLSGDMVAGPHRGGHPEGPQGRRQQGSPALQAVGA